MCTPGATSPGVTSCRCSLGEGASGRDMRTQSSGLPPPRHLPSKPATAGGRGNTEGTQPRELSCEHDNQAAVQVCPAL